MHIQNSPGSVFGTVGRTVSVVAFVLLALQSEGLVQAGHLSDLRVVTWRGPCRVPGQMFTAEFTLIPLDGYSLLGKTGVVIFRGADVSGEELPLDVGDYRLTRQPGGHWQFVIWWSEGTIMVAELNVGGGHINMQVTGHSTSPSQVGATAQLETVRLTGPFAETVYRYAADVRRGELNRKTQLLRQQ